MTRKREYRQEIEYIYKEVQRTANVSVIEMRDGSIYYWFSFRNQPPRCLVFKDNNWTIDGRPPLSEELLNALIEGIKSHPDYKP